MRGIVPNMLRLDACWTASASLIESLKYSAKKASPTTTSRPRTPAKSAFRSGLGEIGESDATAGSITVSRLDAWLAEKDRRLACVERRLTSLPWSVARSASCCAVRLGSALRHLRLRLGRRDLILRRLQLPVDRGLERGLWALDRRRNSDELFGQRVGDGCSSGWVRVPGEDVQERAVQRSIRPDLLEELVCRHVQTELRDYGVEDRPRGSHGGIRRDQSLRDLDLRKARVHRRQRLADDERRLQFIGSWQLAADEERHARQPQ